MCCVTATKSSPATSPDNDDHRHCKYVYKQCTNLRTYKRDGDLHRLCEFHRNKANALQKVYATKRRRELRAQKRQDMLALKTKTVPLPPPQHVKKLTIKLDRVKVEATEARSPTHVTTALLPGPSMAPHELNAFLDEFLEPIESMTDVDCFSDDEVLYLSTVL
ncbi:Aste57867_10479 [Aphanomyces stellatus]|uniref:Aste57867_10479 protein n=1 Tax=Aphanomyces stellatus TaxID=120398 RepID=A0A485KQG3_9STRA|nr:hypothetical protein As57867_010439 [Aphanomyces stellatus]VFT87353.1 Aste57867_10479 [Aphanomyces stellatus]